MSYKSLFSACLTGFSSSSSFTLSLLHVRQQMTAMQVAARWSSQIYGLLTSAQEAPVGGEQTLSSLIRKFVSWISRPCSTEKKEKKNLQGIDNPF